MERLYIKGIILVVMFVASLIFSMLPMKLISITRHTVNPQRRKNYKRCLSFFSCFGGGVFLAACLLDLYPDVRQSLDAVFKRSNIVTSFPMVEFVVTIGFFIMFITEQVVLTYKEGQLQRILRERQPLLHESSSTYDTVVNDDHRSTSGISSEHDDDHSMLISIHEDPNSHSNLRTLVLLLAVSLHSVFEGLALGLLTDISQLWQLLSAVAIHKSIIAFSLGMNLIQTKFKLSFIILCNVIFSAAAPLGMGIGMGVINVTQSIQTLFAAGLLQAVACGTFLYVTFFEILPHEMNNSSDRLLKVLFILLGFSTICAALFLDTTQEN